MAVLKANGSFLKANGKILVRPEGVGDFVVIGGKKYPFVQIGRQLWIVYNLDYSDANIPIGGGLSSSVPKAYYYDQDEATNGWNGRKNNLLYNVSALNYLVQNSSTIFPNGWRVCSNSDMESLIKFAGGASVAGIKLSKGDLDWQSVSWNGTDDFGFSLLPSGTRYGSDGGFHDIGVEAALYTSNNRLYYTLGDGVILISTEHGPASSASIRICKDAIVNIGGRDYPTTKIGNQIWLAENLDFKPTGVTIGTNAWYYNNDEQTYGYRGLLYSWNGVSAIIDSNLLPSGWRVPTKADFENLVLAVGSNAAKKLKASSFGGTDDFGFSILNAGYHDNGVFGDSGTGFWTTSNYSSSAKDTPWFYNNSDSWSWDHITFTGVNAIPIRLVKDA